MKAPSMNTWLKILVERGCKLPSKGSRPWVRRSSSWFNSRLNTVYRGAPEFPLHKWVFKKEWAREIAACTTLASGQYQRNGFENSRSYLKYGLYDLQCQKGQLHLFRMRTGSFLTACRLAQMGFASPELRTTCPFCRANTPETIDHLLVSCSRWSAEREQVFGDNINLLMRELDQASASVLLLGGESSGENNGIEDRILANGEPITLLTIAFLEAIMPQRKQILHGLSSDWPPRVNAQRGTTVLQNGTELTGLEVFAPQGVLVSRNLTSLELMSSP